MAYSSLSDWLNQEIVSGKHYYEDWKMYVQNNGTSTMIMPKQLSKLGGRGGTLF